MNAFIEIHRQSFQELDNYLKLYAEAQYSLRNSLNYLSSLYVNDDVVVEGLWSNPPSFLNIIGGDKILYNQLFRDKQKMNDFLTDVYGWRNLSGVNSLSHRIVYDIPEGFRIPLQNLPSQPVDV